MAKGSRTSQVATSWEETEEAPRAATIDDRKLARKQRMYRVLVWACVLMFIPMVFVTTSALTRGAGEAGKAGAAQSSSPGRTVSTLHLSQWLAQTPSPLPGDGAGKLLSWDGAEDLPAPAPLKGDSAAGFTVEIDHFTVQDGNGAVYRADVQVAVDPRGGAVVMAGPSLMAATPLINDDWASGGPWPNIKNSSVVSESLEKAVQSWAVAYVSGDPGQLALAVGDPDAAHLYVPLSGATGVEAAVSATAAIGKDGADTRIAQVTLQVTWAGQPPGKPGETAPIPTTIDLLIARASTAAPVVVAWGAPGTGPTLSAYQNAVDGTQDREKPKPATAAPTRSATPTPAAS